MFNKENRSYPTIGTTPPIYIPHDDGPKFVRPGRDYFMIQLYGAQAVFAGSVWEQAKSLIVTSKVNLHHPLLGTDSLFAIQRSCNVKKGYAEQLGLWPNLVALVPATMTHISLSIEFIVDVANRLNTLSSLINDDNFLATISLTPGAVMVTKVISSLAQKIIQTFIPQKESEPILQFSGDFNLGDNGLRAGYYIILGTRDEHNPLPNPLPELKILNGKLLADGKNVTQLSYVILDVRCSPARTREWNENAFWESRFRAAESLAQTIASEPDINDDVRKQAWGKCNAILQEAHSLLLADPNYLAREADNIFNTSYKSCAKLIQGKPRPTLGRPLAEDLDVGLVEYAKDVYEARQIFNEKRFDAYPALLASEQVNPGEKFTVTVGFRTSSDPDLLESHSIHIINPPSNSKFLVMLIADGAKVLDGNNRSLPLDLNAQVTFTCRAKPDVSLVTLSVHYIFDDQVVGMAKRCVIVAKTGATLTSDARLAETQSNPCQLSLPSSDSRTDLQVTITQSQYGYLQWTFIASNPSILFGPVETTLQDTREFAANLISELKTYDFTGSLAARSLENKGQLIADKMPPIFFEILHDVFNTIKRPPSLLLLTDETYIPWELAWLEKPLDPELPNFLGVQTQMGRWLLHEKVTFPPPMIIDVKRFTAVAGEYRWANLASLPEALAEQDMLQKRFGAIPVEPTEASLGPIITGDKTPGHLIHFAIHGMSDPLANHQMLLLADNSVLTPGAIAGSYRCGDVPTFAFVFMNACQVGTAGRDLGQATGFPGDLIRGGAQGFIAPLWQIHDDDALAFAKTFYETTLGNSIPISVSLKNLRKSFDRTKSTTPMAYIYYGHPALRLRYQNPGTSDL